MTKITKQQYAILKSFSQLKKPIRQIKMSQRTAISSGGLRSVVSVLLSLNLITKTKKGKISHYAINKKGLAVIKKSNTSKATDKNDLIVEYFICALVIAVFILLGLVIKMQG